MAFTTTTLKPSGTPGVPSSFIAKGTALFDDRFVRIFTATNNSPQIYSAESNDPRIFTATENSPQIYGE